MQQITAIIADDEKELRRHLIKLLDQLWPELIISGESENGPQTLELVHTLSPDIVFLDINMPGLTGIEVARQIFCQCAIVFITAYDQYAIEAFENEALDYLLKPVRKERLLTSIERCKRHISTPAPPRPDIAPLLQQLEKTLLKKNTTPFLQWIRAQHGDSIRLIPIDDVLLFKSSDKYTLVITCKNESLIRKTIKELEQELDPEKFWKIHRGTIVNVSSISKISKSITGKYVIKLLEHDEPQLVSRSYSYLFKQM
ncbi:MAG: LytTR family DNA-binding domain-containing protein [Proteobacteria bacterium]|nr:LytTR family DNA-binding domain-containing protein [Pseudomonadota bacterium]MBU1581291.1 LytTR family DNA-binding domain-containing protein [Pseudomonadota bacterium]MBU2455586.1 LytTR family DNA-binding domain-containing protein [Pseudomonadota bacterium]MBU2627045.1 LytTR family DNA-binding domain-containing protein [Pseudomonadota bacterium]